MRLTIWLSLLVALTTGRLCLAKSSWEVAVLFLGGNEPEDYQRDIDRNLIELARLSPEGDLRLAIYRDFPDRGVTFFPDPKSESLHPLKSLMYDMPYNVQIAGEMLTVESGLFTNEEAAKRFLSKAFRDPKAKRMLVVYGHGLGYEGMQVMALKEMRRHLEATLPKREGKPLDLLWLDACFMANLEVAYELRGIAPFLLASEESEFSAGAPFDSLQDLLANRPDDVEALGRGLAERFLESYSFLEEGTQIEAVLKSSATISLVATGKLEKLTAGLKRWGQSLSTLGGDWKSKVRRRLPKIQMEKTDLVDIGALGNALRSLDLLETKAELKAIGADDPVKLRTNPRILARAPKRGSLLMYGYDRWSRGYEGDEEVIERLPKNLTPEGYSPGPGRKNWPRRAVNVRLYLTPFTVGFERFHFYFLDPETFKPIGKAVSHLRRSDYVMFPADNPENPLRFTGYTQGIGATAERYTGLSVLSPLKGVPSVDYLDLDFFTATRWAEF